MKKAAEFLSEAKTTNKENTSKDSTSTIPGTANPKLKENFKFPNKS